MNGLQSGPAAAIWLVFFERFIAAGMVADSATGRMDARKAG